MIIINISPIPAQRFQCVLDGQYCVLRLRQKGKRMFLDLDLADAPIFCGAICVHGARINQSLSHLFRGTLHFYDMLGKDAPHFEGANSRYFLLYVPDGEEIPAELES